MRIVPPAFARRTSNAGIVLVGLAALPWAWAGDREAQVPPGKAAPPETKASSRPFIGSFQVPPARRDEITRYLKDQGFAGCFVPEGAAPDTLLYRGPKTEYESALTLVWKRLEDPVKPAGPQPRVVPAPRVVPVPRVEPAGSKTDDAIFSQLGLSELQKEHLATLRKEIAAATEAMKQMKSGHIEEGMKINARWRDGLKRILTDDQHSRYLAYWGVPIDGDDQ